MEKHYYTLGMAGHIDHGKTELTKALTQVDTDRLKEEKERKISIEPGYAPLQLEGTNRQVSIIDIPGHEKLIRQMIAGVAGIDLVILVVAADEGVMPQTREHTEILSFLGIDQAIIVITKCEGVDSEWLELVREDIHDMIDKTPFVDARIFCVDSILQKGIPELKKAIDYQLSLIPEKSAQGAFRLPIDQVFTIQGQGTVVRGTIFEGSVKESDTIKILPQGKEVRIRQIQVQHAQVHEAFAGQRAALNLGGISKQGISRGDVLVDSNYDSTTRRLDVSLDAVSHLASPLKQRAPVNVHIGTAIVRGRVIFFDRNSWQSGEQVLSQLELEQPVVAKRGERLIVRRPTPLETLGGGWVINAEAEKHRFGKRTIDRLEQKKEGTPQERILDLFNDRPIITRKALQAEFGEGTLDTLLCSLESSGYILQVSEGQYASTKIFRNEKERFLQMLRHYHEQFPLRSGMDKAEWVQESISSALSEALIASLKDHGDITQQDAYLAMRDFTPHFPEKWQERMVCVTEGLKRQGLQVEPWEMITQDQALPSELSNELKLFVLQQGLAYKLNDTLLVHREAVDENIHRLVQKTGGEAFTLQDAKQILDLSRKYLVPFLELLDVQKYTVRAGNTRKWLSRAVEENS